MPASPPPPRCSPVPLASGLGRPESASWCVPATEVQDLVNLLGSPAVIPIIQRLAVAPCRHLDLCLTASRQADAAMAETALRRLRAADLIDSDWSDIGPAHAWWSLTAGGRELLQPLTALALWYAENRDQFDGISRPGTPNGQQSATQRMRWAAATPHKS